MVFCMSRRVDWNKSQISNLYFFRIFRYDQLIFGYGLELSPKRVHSVTVNTPCTCQQFLRIDHMRRANRMNVDLSALSYQPARRASMIQVNVREQDVSYVAGR